MQNNQELLYLKNILSSIPSNIYWINTDNNFLGCNAEHARVLGLSNEQEIVGKGYYDLIPKKYADFAIAANNEVMRSGKARILEELALVNGKEVVFLSHKAPLYDRKHEVIGLIGNSINITPDSSSYLSNKSWFSPLIPEVFDNLTEYDTVGEYILAIKNYYENMLASLPGHIYWEDGRGIIMGCNNVQALDSGLHDRKEAIGRTIFDFLPKEQAVVHQKNNALVIETGEPQIFEETSTNADGKQSTYISQKIPIKSGRGKTVGILGVSIDITDRKNAEELRIKYEVREKTIKFVHLMAGAMAHELRTPLQGISAHIDLVEGVLTSNQTQQEKEAFLREIVKQIKKVIKNTTETISDMLAKIRAFAVGQLPKQSFEERSITADVEEFLDIYPFENDQRDLVKVVYGARFKYLGDKTLTNHLLTNLLKNAIHAIGETDKTDADITIETRADRDFNQLIIKDTATGISAEFAPKIFDQFETKKSTSGGTGLGLAFCKMIMEGYGGSISCDSKDGKYTKFVLSFPKTTSNNKG